MTQAELKILLNKYAEGTLSTEEQVRLDQWYLHQARNGQSLTDAGIYEKRMRELDSMLFIEQSEKSKTFKLWPHIAVTAAAVAAIVFGVWFFNYRSAVILNSVQDPALAMNDIAPGKNTATLTLANGKTIVLSDAKTGVVVRQDKLAYNDGSVVRYSSGTRSSGSLKSEQMTTGPVGVHSLRVNELLTAATPRGGTYQVTLPDGTKVWLNADSKISFPSQFNRKERKVLIEGEVYFEVAKNKKMPFIVESGGQRVEVLGTHFNVSAYQEESATRTTLLEGSVRIMSEGQQMVIKPGEQSLLYDGGLKVHPADIDEVIAWKEGDFNFNGEAIRSIMQKLARWYDIEVSYEGKVSEELYYARISRNRNISEVLKKLEQAQGVHFKIEGRRVTVTP